MKSEEIASCRFYSLVPKKEVHAKSDMQLWYLPKKAQQ